jgi:hypothetical protein
MTMAILIGDELISNKRYQELRQLHREARATQPFKAWASYYLSPAGARDRELLRRREQYEAANKAQVWEGITAQRAAMDAESGHAPQDPEVARLRELANERDETGGYSMAALTAQRQLAAMGMQPRAGRVG